ncbi:hypothetical protein DFS33DRAFT_1384425 [Desarmillaria ectypa]|nr:hypothetical protein DFS33DRAFT_1384425 [Desarmillaria ectypa]
MSSPQAAPKVTTAEHPSVVGGDKHVVHVPAARAPHVKQREALKLRLDLNLEVDIQIHAKVNGDITLSLLPAETDSQHQRKNGSFEVDVEHRKRKFILVK